MWKWQGLLALLCAVACAGLPGSRSRGADKEPEKSSEKSSEKATGKLAGILIDKQERWLTVKADGEDEPVKYVIPESDKKCGRLETWWKVCTPGGSVVWPEN